MLNIYKNFINIIIFSILLISVLPGLHCTNQSSKQPIIIDGVLDLRTYDFKEKGPLPLTGDWEFYWRKLLLPAADRNTTRKQTPDYLHVPTSWNRQRLKGQKIPAHGYGTYKIKVLLNSNPGPLALNIPGISTAYQLYVNGKLLEEGGKIGKSKDEMVFRYNATVVDLPYKKTSAKHEVVEIRFIVSNFHQSFGGIWISPELGSKNAVHKQREFNLVRDFTIFGLLLIMAVYHLILFILRPKESLTLYFAAFCLLVALRIPTHNEYYILKLIPSIPILLLVQLQYGTIYLGLPVMAMFFRKAFPHELGNKLLWPIMALSLPFCGLVIFGSTQLLTWSLPYYHAVILLTIVAFLYVVIRATVNKRPGAYFLLVGSLILMVTALHDIMFAKGWIFTGLILKYGMLALILCKSTLLSWRFYNAFEAVENLSGQLRDLNQNLERKVETRTEELQNTLSQVNDLKFQQDADYYLTSLLIKPLGGNHTEGPLVKVDILESQYKRFTFRNKQVELGGDYSYADSIKLQGKEYTIVLNSDAMGKSMQGAGGSLVLGSVIRSIITRTQNSPEHQASFPEQWLGNCYQELQNVFLTFDGSMLISLVLGLIGKESGFLYYFNAEHPGLVLYRNGRARFVEEEVSLMKIGIMLPQEELTIRTFQLQRDDVLLLGSDGRDDIVLGTDENGQRIINEDANGFLQHVENGHGHLQEIKDSILKSGALMDDFSLLRVGYNEDILVSEKAPDKALTNSLAKAQKLFQGEELYQAAVIYSEILEKDKINPAALKSLAKIHTRTKNFESAALLWQRYTEVNPADTKAIFNTSIVLQKLDRLPEAASFSERLLLREPNWVRNLENLVFIYTKLRKMEKAREIQGKIKQLASRKEGRKTLVLN